MSSNSALTQAKANRLIAQIGDLRKGRTTLARYPILGTNDTEGAFLDHLAERKPGASAFRAGWPDFLVEHEGNLFCVEVKSGHDDVRESQRTMFAALDRAGIRTYVWHPRRPLTLTPWRAFRPL
jgi:hypothetical protein